MADDYEVSVAERVRSAIADNDRERSWPNSGTTMRFPQIMHFCRVQPEFCEDETQFIDSIGMKGIAVFSDGSVLRVTNYAQSFDVLRNKVRLEDIGRRIEYSADDRKWICEIMDIYGHWHHGYAVRDRRYR